MDRRSVGIETKEIREGGAQFNRVLGEKPGIGGHWGADVETSVVENSWNL